MQGRRTEPVRATIPSDILRNVPIKTKALPKSRAWAFYRVSSTLLIATNRPFKYNGELIVHTQPTSVENLRKWLTARKPPRSPTHI